MMECCLANLREACLNEVSGRNHFAVADKVRPARAHVGSENVRPSGPWWRSR